MRTVSPVEPPCVALPDKHGGRAVFRRVESALLAQDFLHPRDVDIIERLKSVMRESRPPMRPRKRSQARTRSPAMQIQANIRGPFAQLPPPRPKQRFDVRIAFKYGPEAILDHNGNANIGPRALQDSIAGVVSTQSPSERSLITATRQPVGSFRSLFDLCLVNQHHRDIIPNRVDPVTLHALQAAIVRLQIEIRLAQGTNQDLKQIFAQGHN